MSEWGAMEAIRLTDQQRLDWLRLIRSEHVGPRTFRVLINRFGGAAAALDALPELGRKQLGRPINIFSEGDAEQELTVARRADIHYVALGEPDYPKALRAIADPPPLLAVKGSDAACGRAALAIVGSRNASAVGRRMAATLAAEIGQAGYTIVSGLARGIDVAAHEASVESGTVAVLAGGHGRLYPADHEPLAARIVERGGAIVSEMPFDWEPRGRDFPRRNRLISGLALGTVIVEAARKSGSLITARFALEQGREVFAVPGSPLDPRAEGTNNLIRQGATLVSSAEHVLEVLAPLRGAPPALPQMADSEGEAHAQQEEPLFDELQLEEGGGARQIWRAPDDPPLMDESQRQESPADKVLALLTAAPIGIDDVARMANLPARVVSRVVFELELAGQIERHGVNSVSRILTRS